MGGNSRQGLSASQWAHSNVPSNPPYFQQNNIVQQNGTYHLDPAHAPFQPSGELERHQAPRTVNGLPDHYQLLNLVQNHNIQQITEATRLDQHVRGIHREFDAFRSTIKNHVETLEKKVTNLESSRISVSAQKQITASGPAEDSASKLAAEYEYYHIDGHATPTEEMLANHPKEAIAKNYIEEADKRCASAVMLRQQAVEMCPNILDEATLAGQRRLQIEAPPVVTPGFACCQTEFPAIGELVEHVELAHTAPEHRLLARSKAVEIKSPRHSKVDSVIGESRGEPREEVKEVEATQQETIPWKPTAVRDMPQAITEIPEDMQTFSFEFLRTTFSGNYWSPGYYFVPRKSILPSKSYWMLDLTHEPFLPTLPGHHGAKLTAFFNETVSGDGEAPEEENYQNAPVFIKASGKDEYSYFGNYSQLRFSDKLGYDTITEHVPESVLHFHAEQLSELGRPEWVTQALKQHFWPKPSYDGPIPTDSAINSPAPSVQNGSSITAGLERRVMRGLVEYAAELKVWDKDSKFKVSRLTSESIFEAFSAPDADLEPGLRLYWEYLQCVGWDAGFYKMLVGLKDSPTTKLEIGGAGKKRLPSPDRHDGSTAAKKGLPPQSTFKLAKPRERMEVHPGPDARTKFVRPDFSDKPVGSGFAKDSKKIVPKTNGVPPAGPKGESRVAGKVGEQLKSVPPHRRGK